MQFLAEAIYPGTAITFLPDWLAALWRIAVWVAIVALVTRMAANSFRTEQMSRILVYGRAAMMILLLSAGLLDAERWGHQVTWEGLPPVTIALFISWRAIKIEEDWRKNFTRDKK